MANPTARPAAELVLGKLSYPAPVRGDRGPVRRSTWSSRTSIPFVDELLLGLGTLLLANWKKRKDAGPAADSTATPTRR